MNSENTTLPEWLQDSEHVQNLSWLHPEQILMLIEFSNAWRSHDKIAKALGLSGEQYVRFLKDMNNAESSLRSIVDFARLKNAGEIKANAAIRAKESASGLKAYTDLQNKEELEELKEALLTSTEPEDNILFGKTAKDELSLFNELQDFFLNGKDTDTIPETLKQYWAKLNIVHDILSSFQFRARGRKYCMKIIRSKLDCSEPYAYRLINESITFFNIQENKNSWYKRLLEDLEKIKALAWKSNDLDFFIDAVKAQTKILADMKDHEDIPAELFTERIIITSHSPEEFGIEPVNRKELMAMINKWKLSNEEKLKLKNEISINVQDHSEENISE